MATIVSVPSPARGRAMIAAIWLAGLLALLLWSLASWITALAFTGGGDFVATQAARWAAYYPELELAVDTGAAWLSRFGSTALWLLWALGALVIVFCTWLAVEGARSLRRGLARVQPHVASAWSDVRRRLEAHGAQPAGGPN